ncbi:MAG: glycosyltransferase [Gemmatimonadales bacterium]
MSEGARGGDRPLVSIVTPAFNAADTIAEALESVLAQTQSGWEALVVDDGSTDDTAAVVGRFADRDRRIRLVRSDHAGEAAARNVGLQAAAGEWLLCLDADDWLLPEHLDRLLALTQGEQPVDVACCGWARVTPDGERIDEEHRPDLVRPFDELARFNPFAVHSCLVRRRVVANLGGFDTTLVTCADWDLWQRIARAGHPFAADWKVLAHYRIRPSSSSHRPLRVLADGLAVIARGHRTDSRVSRSAPGLERGRPSELEPEARLHLAVWTAGMLLAQGGDPDRVWQAPAGWVAPDLDPAVAASSLLRAAAIAAGTTPERADVLWRLIEPGLGAFLPRLERESQAAGLARRVGRRLERAVIGASKSLPVTVGATHAIRVEVTRPFEDVTLGADVERLRALVEVEGRRLGSIELPVFDGVVPGLVLADQVAARFGWEVLQAFFARTLVPPSEVGAWAAERNLVPDEQEPPTSIEGLMAGAGWLLFLQELWGEPTGTLDRFYDPASPAGGPTAQEAVSPRSLELSRELPVVATPESGLLPCTVGGIAIGLVSLADLGERVEPGQLRAAIIDASGFDSCLIAVREAILGRPFDAESTRLRERLRALAEARPAESTAAIAALLPRTPGLVLGRRAPIGFGTSSTRRAALPIAAAAELGEMAMILGEPVAASQVAEASTACWARYLPAWLPPAESTRVPPVIGPVAAAGSAESELVSTLPILMYHRVAPEGAAATSRYRISPAELERQLRWLRDHGYEGVDLDAWGVAVIRRRPLPGRRVLITFDDGYADFADHAWPLLKRYGYPAWLFVVSGRIGATNAWDRARGESLPCSTGTGSDGSATRAPDRLALEQPCAAVRARTDGAGPRPRALPDRALPGARTADAGDRLPHGDADAVVRHVAGACGFVFGLSTWGRQSVFGDDLLWLPRLEIRGDQPFEAFVAKVQGEEER